MVKVFCFTALIVSDAPPQLGQSLTLSQAQAIHLRHLILSPRPKGMEVE
jgi:hypothetical protein